MLGIDISEHNGYIDFTKLKNQGIEFVILRLGWLGNKNNHTKDKYFDSYYDRAKANGIKIGLYVYNYCNNIKALQNGVEWIKMQMANKKIDLPIFLDMEDTTIKIAGKNDLTLQCIYFCEELKNNGLKTGIYANKDWLNNYLNINELLNYYIWLAEWNSKITVDYRVDFWQYTSKGRLKGINSNVDMNIILNNYTQHVDNSVEKGGFDVKEYQNGSTIEKVYQDANLTKLIGHLNINEKCKCYGTIRNSNNKEVAIVLYKIDNSNPENQKVGFVEYLGGIKCYL